MRVIVLGAGVVGTASAWYLRQAGLDVIVLERQGGPALETSFANGGQISVSHAEPWANPATLLTVLRELGRADAPLLACGSGRAVAQMVSGCRSGVAIGSAVALTT